MEAGPGQLREWFDAYGDTLVLYARQWLAGGSAEDVVQDVFVKLLAQRRTPTSPKAWLFRAVRNAAWNHRRSQQRRRRREQVCAEARGFWFEARPDAPIDAQTAQAALMDLPPPQREIVILRIWAGMTLDEAAETLGEPVSTLHSRYAAAVKALRERIGARCRNETT